MTLLAEFFFAHLAVVLDEKSVLLIEVAAGGAWLRANRDVIVDTMNQAGLLSDASLELVSEEWMVLLRKRLAVDASADADALSSAEAALVSLRVLGVGTHLGDSGDRASVAAHGDGVAYHLDLNAASFRCTQVTNGELGVKRQLVGLLKSVPLRVEVHHGDVEDCDHEEDYHERVDDAEVRNHTVSKTRHRILIVIQMEVELVLAEHVILSHQVKIFGLFESVVRSEALAFFCILCLDRVDVAVPFQTPSGHSHDWVQEGETALDRQEVKRMHRAKSLLRSDDLRCVNAHGEQLIIVFRSTSLLYTALSSPS